MPKQTFKQAPPFKCLPSVDFNNLLSGLFRLAVAHFEPSSAVSNVSAGVSDLIKSIKLKEMESDGAKAYRLLLFALGEASAQVLLDDYSRNYDFKATFSYKDIKQVTEQAQNEEDFTFDDTFLSTPAEHPLVARFLENFQSLLEQSGANKRLLYGLEEKFKSYYIDAFHSEFSENYGQYSVLDSLLQNTTTPAYQREREWKEYRAQLIKQVYQPIFNEHFGLRQIYVPLNAYYHTEEGTGKEKQKKKVICRMEEELDEWMTQKAKRDTLRIITGDPGAGKSTIAKVWASKLAERGKRVIFISLNQVRKSTRPEEVIAEFINSKSHRFRHNPYDLLGKEETTPILFIFDGLDEWIAEGSKSVESVKLFIREALRLLKEANVNKVILRALLLSRPIAIQENLEQFEQDCRVYHVLPLYVTEKFSKDNTIKYELLEEDKRPIWKALYTKFNRLNFKETLLQKDKGEIAEISAQPLLIYLLTIALNAAEGEINEESINVNSIYADILNHVYEREYEDEQKHRQTEDLTKDQYFEIMENIACSAWRRGDERTTTQKAISQQFKEQPKKIQKLWDKYADEVKGSRGVEALLSSFYFQKKESVSEDALYEFSHKSFGEYLMARYVIRILRKLSAIYRGDTDEAEDENIILRKWYEQFHHNGFEMSLISHIVRELILERFKKNNKILVWQEDLTVWLDKFKNGLFIPEQSSKSFLDFRKEEGNTLFSMLSLLSMVAFVNQQTFSITGWGHINYKNDETYSSEFRNWLSKISYQGDKYLTNIKLSGSWMFCLYLSDYKFASGLLSDTIWELVRLDRVKFHKANLETSHFTTCLISDCHFNRTNLRDFTMTDCRVTHTDFKLADFRNSTIRNCHFSNVSLDLALLDNASFINVHFFKLNVKKNQLSKVKTLYGSTGLPEDIHEALQAEKYKHLWEKPKEKEKIE